MTKTTMPATPAIGCYCTSLTTCDFCNGYRHADKAVGCANPRDMRQLADLTDLTPRELTRLTREEIEAIMLDNEASAAGGVMDLTPDAATLEAERADAQPECPACGELDCEEHLETVRDHGGAW